MADLDDLNDRPPVVAALTYASRGWPVFPVAWALEGTCACRLGPSCTHPAKHPLVPGGTASATTDLALVRSWWAHWPRAGIGLLTGSRSGLAVLDIDPGHDGAGTLSALGSQGIVVPPTLCADTGGGGQHYFFAIAGGRPCTQHEQPPPRPGQHTGHRHPGRRRLRCRRPLAAPLWAPVCLAEDW